MRDISAVTLVWYLPPGKLTSEGDSDLNKNSFSLHTSVNMAPGRLVSRNSVSYKNVTLLVSITLNWKICYLKSLVIYFNKTWLRKDTIILT